MANRIAHRKSFDRKYSADYKEIELANQASNYPALKHQQSIPRSPVGHYAQNPHIENSLVDKNEFSSVTDILN